MGEPESARPVARVGRLVRLVAPYRARFALATVALAGGSAIGLIYPQAARLIIDEGVIAGAVERIDLVALGILGLVAVQGGLVYLRHYLMSWLGERAVADLRAQVFERLIRLPPAWFHERRTGELVSRMAADVATIQWVVGSEVSIALRNVLNLAGGLALMSAGSPRLALAMIAVVPPMTLAVVAFGRRIRRMSRALQDRLAAAGGQLQECVAGIETVQSFVRERYEVRRYAADVEDAFRAGRRLAMWRAGFMAAAAVAGLLGLAAVGWLGARAVVAGELSPGGLAAFLLYALMVSGAIASLAGLWGSLQRAAGATDRLFDIIDTTPDIRDPDAPAPLPAGGGEIRFEDVRFRYPGRPHDRVIEGVNLRIRSGDVVALVGPSGAGKTTLTALLQRFYDVDGGRVLLEGTDVRRLALDDLRGAMAVVGQGPVLFSGSLRDNIMYGARRPVSQADVEAAARDAHADGFITAFPDGYDTPVGERGVTLSGGQRQRVAIARALLADPRILILDEATSDLDAESEALVQAALARLMRGRTTLIIAHRLSTVRDADRIVVMDRGRVVEEGSHAELMGEAGVYRRLVDHQLVGSD